MPTTVRTSGGAWCTGRCQRNPPADWVVVAAEQHRGCALVDDHEAGDPDALSSGFRARPRTIGNSQRLEEPMAGRGDT
jgi:hypothetical protein